MLTLLIRKMRLFYGQLILLSLLMIYFLYFFYAFLYGEQGYFSYRLLSEKALSSELIKQKSEQNYFYWRIKVRGLDSRHPDLDMIEERVRRILNYGRAGELTIFLD